jgi:8-oxo-dGTP diphosphatase
MLPVAVLWLINERGEFLLAKRSDTKKHDPGVWGPSVTGKLEANETVEQALERETEEELGLTADAYQALPLFNEEFRHADGVIRQMNIYYALVHSDITLSCT